MRRHSPPTVCRHTVSGTISLPSQGFFSPFPHGTGSLSVRSEYLALRNGLRRFPQSFSCSAVLRYPVRVQTVFTYAAVTLCGPSFQRASVNGWIGNSTVRDPTTPVEPEGLTGLGCCDFARHYYRNRGFFLFLQVLRWFTSLGSLRRPMYSVGDTLSSSVWVSPFGNLRIKACLRLPEAYRSLPRPSSPASAKASTMRP